MNRLSLNPGLPAASRPFPSALCLLLSVVWLLPGPAPASVWSVSGTDSLFARLEDVKFSDIRIGADGTVRLASRLTEADVIPTEEAAVWQVCRDRTGSLYLATGHMTRLFRTRGLDSRATSIFSGNDGEILALAADQQGNVWFGTTPAARVYRVRPGAEPEEVAALDASYVFSVLPDPNGGVLCATGDHGRLYRVAAGTAPQEIYAASETHLTALTWLVPGRELLVGSSPGGLVYRLLFKPAYPRPEASVLYDTPLAEIRAIASGPSGRVFIAANPATEGDDATGSPVVFCLDSAGVRRWEWTCPDSVLFSLLWRDGMLWVATGNNGAVYGLDTLGRVSVLLRLEQPQVLSLTPDGERLLVSTGNSGRLFALARTFADSGQVAAAPFDCGNPARFGRLDFRADVPAGTGLRLDLRSGNSESPDSTWSGWSGSPPPGRFVQWCARLQTSFPDLTPSLRRVDLYYTTANLAPTIDKLEVNSPSPADARRGLPKPLREASWEASDPEGDSLVFDLSIRPEGAANWRRLGREQSEAKYEFDTRTLPDGWYELRLTASDHGDRPVQTALTSERILPAFVIDNTPPQISNLRTTSDRLTFAVSDALSPVAGCRVALNAGDWFTAEPADGVFDSPTEQFSVPVRLEPGDNVIAVWASDAQGNSGSARTTAR